MLLCVEGPIQAFLSDSEQICLFFGLCYMSTCDDIL